MKRRDFLLSATGRSQLLDLSCETLYMQYVDARIDDEVDEFFEELATKIARAHTVRLRQSFWLQRQDLASTLKPLLERLRAAGGDVEYV